MALTIHTKFWLGTLMLSLPFAPELARAESSAQLLSREKSENFVTRSDLRFFTQENESSLGILPRGTNVTFLETKEDPGLGTLMRLGVNSDDESLPSEVWVPMQEAVSSGLDLVDEGDVDEVAADDEAAGGLFVDARGRVRKKRMTYCYAYVKQYLIKIGKVQTYLPGSSAYMAAGILPRYGFHRLSGGPESAQINDVCVYRGGNGGNGHIEVRVQGGWYYGYGVKPHPITRHNHPFIGCYRK